MRVGFLISALAWRGSGVSFARIARGLSAGGHEVTAIAGNDTVAAGFRDAGVPVAVAGLRTTGTREVLGLRELIERLGLDVIIADKARDARFALLARRRRRTAVIYRYNVVQGVLKTHLAERLLLQRSDLLVFQCRYLEQKVRSGVPWLARVRGQVIYNGFQVEEYRTPPDAGRLFREQLGIAANQPMVLSPALLDRVKAPDVAIDATAEASRLSGTSLTLVLPGDGPLRAELAGRATARGVDARFPGLLTRDQVLAACHAADVVLHPAREEIFPNAVAEAMACGAAIIASDAGGTGELLGDDGVAGLLVPVDAVEQTGARINELLRDPARRQGLGAAAQRRLAAEFPVSAMVEGYEAALLAVSGK